MTEIKCNVAVCSYNKNNCCHANPLNIVGTGSPTEDLTCCGSFLNQQHYSNIAEYKAGMEPADAVNCSVTTCAYNKKQQCSLNEIQVAGGKNVSIYTETKCSSFDRAE